MDHTPALVFVAFVIVFGLLHASVLAQQVSDVTITKGAGSSGQVCVSAKNCFDPDVISIALGTAVTWKNTDQVSHTVTSGDISDNQIGTVFDSGLIAPGKEFTFAFKNAGTYHYFCTLHPWMTGEVVVGTSSASSPEFGQVAPMILVIAIMSTMVISARCRVLKL
ncbi:MAG: cupredoxin domain-containing protein [Thaumarchaeota archaeon]|nr:cupredoxin domain-containing protein [Nitrososphaerota archaeon]